MKIGFIGAGNMARAILTGIASSKKTIKINKNDIFVSNRTKSKLDEIKKVFQYNVTLKNDEVLKKAKDIIFLCIKPQVFDEIKNDLKKHINKDQMIVSIMAGKSIDYLEESLGTKNIIRVMPNALCLVNAGISALAIRKYAKIDAKKNVSDKYIIVRKILMGVGELVEVDEKYINAITQVSGASPAWVFMMIESLADGGVACGMPRDMAYKFAASAVCGSGKLMKERNLHPGFLKDLICSPAGTTIEGVKVLEEKGFRGAVIDAVVAAYNKSIKI